MSTTTATATTASTSSASQVLLSPAELSYLHTSLCLTPPIRPDLRSPTQFRPLVAETDVLPGANGSARICFADGSEAIVGVKAEVEKQRGGIQLGQRQGQKLRGQQGQKEETTRTRTIGGPVQSASQTISHRRRADGDDEHGDGDGTHHQGGEGGEGGEGREGREGGQRRASPPDQKGDKAWVELTIDMPGFRDDDALPVFLAAMLNEALLASGDLPGRLCINRRYHWRLYIDVGFDFAVAVAVAILWTRRAQAL